MKISPLLKILIPLAVISMVAFSLDPLMNNKVSPAISSGGTQLVAQSEVETDLARLDRIEVGNRAERKLSEDDIEFLTSTMQKSEDERLQSKAGIILFNAYAYELADPARLDRAFQEGILGCNDGAARSLFIITYSQLFSEGLSATPETLREESLELQAESIPSSVLSPSEREFLKNTWDAGIKNNTAWAQAIIVEKSDLRGDDAQYLSAYIRKWIEATDGRVRKNWKFIFKVFTAFNTDHATVQKT